MSWLGRLFGSSTPPPPPPNSVVIAEEVAIALTAAGGGLSAAVDAALRAHLEAEANAAAARGERLPFWLAREKSGPGEMEDELRDRVIQRRAAEDEH